MWLCLAPRYTPLLRPVPQVRGIDIRPFEALTRWLQIADIHTPDDIRDILSDGGEQTPGAYSPFGNGRIRLLLRTTGLKA
eukprot:9105094-Pyramimonas_sp.AAC.1